MPEGGELLEREYILSPGAALMLDAARRPTAATSSQRASQVYDRMGQQ